MARRSHDRPATLRCISAALSRKSKRSGLQRPGGLQMMMICSHRFRLLFLGAQGVHLGLDRRRAHDGQLRDLNPLVGRHHANDALDFGPPLGARSAHEERDLRTVLRPMSISLRRTVERSTPSSSASLGIFFTCLAASRTGTTGLLPVRGGPRLPHLGMEFSYTKKEAKIGARDGPSGPQ